jgi:hypothetical protein
MNFLEFCKVSVIFWILNLNKLLNIPVCFYPRTLTCGVVDWVSCHDGNDQSTATSGPTRHVDFAGDAPVSDDDGVLATPRARGVYQMNRLAILSMIVRTPPRKGHRS